MESRCGILKYLEYARAYQLKLPREYLKSWGVKYVACRELFTIDAIVCEKQSIPFSTSPCGNEFFECEDGTCILSTYTYDLLNDCFDNSDEDKYVDYLQNGRRVSQSIDTGCELNINCSLPQNQSGLFLHDMCDGIFSSLVFVKEVEVCQNNDIVTINLLHLQYERVNIFTRWTERTDHKRILMANKYSMSEKNAPEYIPASTNQAYQGDYKLRKLLCHYQTRTHIDDRCRIDVHGKLCNSGPTTHICTDIMCPGMFKCHGYYCIPVSYVCDGQSDCLYGDDETYCDLLVCPGSIKCRGENKCVGSEDICDGIPNCLYSFDDEVSCDICPSDCRCDGYMISCVSVNALGNHSSRIYYSKGLVVKGLLKQFNVTYYMTNLLHLLYLDISQCSLSDVVFTSNYDRKPRLLHANFSSNLLVNIHFTANLFFRSVLIIDFTNNFITHIHLRHVLFKYLIVFVLNGNFIKEVHFKNTLSNLRFLKLKNVRFNPHMIINVPILCNIIVSYPRMCCTLPVKSICKTFDDGKIACFGIFHNLVSKIYIYTIVILSIASLFFKLCRSIFDSSWINDHKFYYISTTVNYTIADLLSIIHSVVLISVDISRINWLFWRKSLFCRFLRGMISLSLRASLIYKTICMIIITLKIIYPFRHQVRWLKYLPLASFFIWIVLVCLDITSTVTMSDIYLDQFCTFLNCHDKLTYMILGRVAIDFVCVIMFISCLSKTYAFLKQRRSRTSSGSLQTTKQINISKVSLKMGRLLYADTVLRTMFFISYIVKYICPFKELFCLVAVFYIIPFNIIIFNLVNSF